MRKSLSSILPCLLLASACSSYIPPGPRADLNALAPASVQEGFAARPAAAFPASIAAVHVQAPSYTNFFLERSGGTVGGGRYCVITVRDAEDAAQFDRIAHLPQVAGLVSLNRMLLPAQLETDRELRDAAARLQADLVLLYTFDTSFFDSNASRPLSVLTLGFAPTKRVYVTTTASALLLDTRTGYVYSAYEVTSRTDLTSSFWGSRESLDEGRRTTERESFGKLVDEFTGSWSRVVERNAKRG